MDILGRPFLTFLDDLAKERKDLFSQLAYQMMNAAPMSSSAVKEGDPSTAVYLAVTVPLVDSTTLVLPLIKPLTWKVYNL